MKMNKEQVGSFIRQHASNPEEILKEPSLVRRIRTLPNDEARLAFINKLQPPPPKVEVKENDPPKMLTSKKTLSVKMTRKTARKRTKKTLDKDS